VCQRSSCTASRLRPANPASPPSRRRRQCRRHPLTNNPVCRHVAIMRRVCNCKPAAMPRTDRLTVVGGADIASAHTRGSIRRVGVGASGLSKSCADENHILQKLRVELVHQRRPLRVGIAAPTANQRGRGMSDPSRMLAKLETGEWHNGSCPWTMLVSSAMIGSCPQWQ